jgi:hypothetical protein
MCKLQTYKSPDIGFMLDIGRIGSPPTRMFVIADSAVRWQCAD